MPEVQADFAESLEAAAAVGEAHMEAEKAKKLRLKTKQHFIYKSGPFKF